MDTWPPSCHGPTILPDGCCFTTTNRPPHLTQPTNQPLPRYVPSGSNGNCAAFVCPAGTSDDDLSPATPCVPCPLGHYTPAGVNGTCAAFACAAGWTDDDSNPATPWVFHEAQALRMQCARVAYSTAPLNSNCIQLPLCLAPIPLLALPAARPFPRTPCHRWCM